MTPADALTTVPTSTLPAAPAASAEAAAQGAPSVGMATTTLEVVAPGALTTLQDLGRHGFRRFGVPAAGVLDPALLQIANALAGQPGGHAALEFFGAGPTLKAVDGPLRIGLAGDFSVTVQRADGQRSQGSAWRSLTLWPGDTLRAGTLRSARAGVLAVRGLQVAPVLGSASTYQRAQLGGHQGRALAAGDRLQASALPLRGGRPLPALLLRRPPAPASGPIRVVPGPQADHFDPAVLHTFFSTPYTVTADADRMGVRLQGTALAHNQRGAEIASDATVPGSVQVPGNGQPIVLLADGQTAGGYPKIGTVASADLARLALAPVGSVLRFQPVTVAEAEDLAAASAAALQRLLATIEPLGGDGAEGDIDLAALYAANLVSGMVQALDPD